MRHGFSLVELSIVLVILGLLTGGILSGQSLIRAAELRALSSEYNTYTTSLYSFRDRYLSIPGDIKNATQFWGRQANLAWCVTNSTAPVGATGVCDGNGDGRIEAAAAASQSGEEFQLWRQLSLAGLIEGSYTGLADVGAYDDLTLGSNIPVSRFGKNTMWRIYIPGSQATWFTMAYGTVLCGGAGEGTSGLKPEELWNMDTKIDDGRPASGKIIARGWQNCTTAVNATDYGATYNLTNSNIVCSFVTPNIF